MGERYHVVAGHRALDQEQIYQIRVDENIVVQLLKVSDAITARNRSRSHRAAWAGREY
jgi:hypothetical protein